MVKRNIVLGNVANVQEFNRICGHMDFDVDTVQNLWDSAKEAASVKNMAESYRGHAREALKLLGVIKEK